ncbi:hypothetical protein CBR_g29372 [Chara braunii]|uniref:BED-type domain-containing protein n=1 Tax=Chara braunii TaxID=69332 RepID=A0A388JWM2_CHABU|nr:hypothetical protein CBR_g29372 [Chara braunii]|eukprot:GBG62173.1 hypothetical protein CBR_g29372 [Chara braunii]
MGRSERRQHEAAADHVQDTFRARSPVYPYLVVGQKVDNKGVMMLRCTFCNKVFQGTLFHATRHFSQTNYCKDVSDEALYEIARRTRQKFEADQMERVSRGWPPSSISCSPSWSFGEVASTGGPEAQATTPTPTRRDSSMPPPPALSPAPRSPVSPLQPDREELGSSLPQRGLLHRGGAVCQLRLRSPSPGIGQEEGGPSAAAVESSMAPAAVSDATIAAAVEEIAAAAASAVLEEMAASVLAEDPPAAGGGAAVEGQVATARGAGGGAAAVEVEVAASLEEEDAPSAVAVEEEIAAQAEVQRGGDDEHLMQQFLTEELGPATAGMTPVLGSEPVVVPPRLPSHFAPQEVRRPLDAEELAREAVRDVTRLDRRIFDRKLEHPPWQSIPSVPWGPASPVWSGSTSTGGHTAGHVPGVSGGVTETAPRTGDMPPPPPRAPAGDPSSSPTGRGSRSPHTPWRSRIRDTTAVQQDVCDMTIFGRTDIHLDSTRRVTEHTARLQPGLGGGGARTTTAREVPASGCEPQRGRGRGVSTDTLEYALRATMRAVQERTPRKRGVPPRPRPVPAEGGAALGESSGAEGLGMPRGSRREQTIAEASARVVVLRKGGGPVTIEEDDPDTDAAVRDADKDYEGEEEGEEDSRSGSDGDDDDYDEPPPSPGPPPTRASRRSAARTSSSSRGRKRLTSDTRGGTRRHSEKGKKGR